MLPGSRSISMIGFASESDLGGECREPRVSASTGDCRSLHGLNSSYGWSVFTPDGGVALLLACSHLVQASVCCGCSVRGSRSQEHCMCRACFQRQGLCFSFSKGREMPAPPPLPPPVSEATSSRQQQPLVDNTAGLCPRKRGTRLLGAWAPGQDPGLQLPTLCRQSGLLLWWGGGPAAFLVPTHVDSTSPLFAFAPFSDPEIPGVSFLTGHRLTVSFIIRPALRCQVHASAFLTSFVSECNNQCSMFWIGAVDLEEPIGTLRSWCSTMAHAAWHMGQPFS